VEGHLLEERMKKVKYLVVVNLSGIHGPITLYRALDTGVGRGWWDRSGNHGTYDADGFRKDSECYEFATDSKGEAKAFKLGSEILAKRLKAYLA
jgi:hypothetical protein